MRDIQTYLAEGQSARDDNRTYLRSLIQRHERGERLSKDEALDLAIAFLQGLEGWHTDADVNALIRARWSMA